MEVIRGNTPGTANSPVGKPKAPPTYTEVLSQFKVGLMPKDYPMSRLSTTMMELVEESILAIVVDKRKEQFKPKFTNCRFRSGFIVIECQNQETADWLKGIVPSIKPWETADLMVVDSESIPRPEILAVFFPKSEKNENETILALVESHNDIATDSWRVLKRKPIKNHVQLILSVDEASAKKIADWNYKLNFKFGIIYPRKIRAGRSFKSARPESTNNAVIAEKALPSLPSDSKNRCKQPVRGSTPEGEQNKHSMVPLNNHRTQGERKKPPGAKLYRDGRQEH
ncbi:uncharacterized protein LOC129729212 [Wyeomyia smithii]|uniref:uncharacterized protein LOC129729212 n=1 Tax=Wyeomyia smithii TaxID=174621 RepID=UPI0024682166|nr:uncharacterized protein LOC129729212 [Wyeomyia smithii]